MRTMKLTVLCALLAMTACECAPQDGGGDGGDDNGSSDGQGGCDGPYRTILGGFCDVIDRCPNGYPIAYRSREECQDILCWAATCRLEDDEVSDVHHYRLEQHIPDVSAPDAELCAQWLQSAPCEVLDGSNAEQDGEPNPCDGLFVAGDDGDDDDDNGGGIAVGASCEEATYDCTSGAYCKAGAIVEAEGAYACAVCTALPQEGEDCSGNSDCAGDLACVYDDEPAGSTCIVRREAGASCTTSDACTSGFCNFGTNVCDDGGEPGDACTVRADCRQGFCDGVCRNQLRGGEVCGDPSQCSGGECDEATNVCGRADGLQCSYGSQCASNHCDDATSLCAPGVVLGGSCQYDDDCGSGYCAYPGYFCAERCDSDADCGDGERCGDYPYTCLPLGEDGATCRGDEDCVSGWCDQDSEQCGKQPEIGDACTGYSSCYPFGYCRNGFCAAREEPGADCEGYDSCQEPFLCLEGKCRIINLQCEPAEAGELCAYLRVCDGNSYCDFGGSFRCRLRVPQGESCGSTEQCRPNLFCDYQGGAVCAPRALAGAACTDDDGCRDGLFCMDDGTGAATCGAGPLGLPCDSYGAPCPDGLVCVDDRCAEPGVAGEACDSYDAPCADGFNCVYDVCEAPRAEGVSCNDYGAVCEVGLYCDSSQGCTRAPGATEPCSYSIPCADEAYCDYSDYLCKPDLQQDAACDGSYDECAAGLLCEYDSTAGLSKCRAMGATGEDCDDDEECSSGACDYTFGCLATAQCIAPE